MINQIHELKKYEIMDNNFIKITESIKTLNDSMLITERINGFIIKPGDDISNLYQDIKDLCSTIWYNYR